MTPTGFLSIVADYDTPSYALVPGSERAAAYGRVWSVMHEPQERTARRKRR